MNGGSTIDISITSMTTVICLLYRSKLNQSMTTPEYTKAERKGKQEVVGSVDGEITGQSERATTLQDIPFFSVGLILPSAQIVIAV